MITLICLNREESNNYAKTLAYEDRSFFSNEKSVNLFDQRSSEDNKSSVLEENKGKPLL